MAPQAQPPSHWADISLSQEGTRWDLLLSQQATFAEAVLPPGALAGEPPAALAPQAAWAA